MYVNREKSTQWTVRTTDSKNFVSTTDRPSRRPGRSNFSAIIQSDHARQVHLVLWKKGGKYLVRQFIGRRATYPARETIKKTMIHRDTRSCSTVEFHRGVAAPSVKLSSINRRIEEQKEQFPWPIRERGNSRKEDRVGGKLIVVVKF